MNWMPQQMLQLPEFSLAPHYREQSGRTLIGIWRWRKLIAGLVVASVAIAAVIAVILPKTYTAETILQLDFGGEPARSGQPGGDKGAALDAIALVESDARVIRSRAIARRVVERLDLTSDPAFASGPSRVSRLLAWLSGAPAPEETATAKDQDRGFRTEMLAGELMRRVSVSNDTRSYLITIAYTTGNPVRSAAIVNAFADEYLRNRIEANVAAAERTSTWLASQIAETRTALGQAEEAVNGFRVQTRFVEANAEGSSLLQKQLTDLTTELGTATQTRMAAEGRLARARQAVAVGNVPSAQDLAGSPLIQRLLENEAIQKREVSDLALIGPKHPGLARAQAAAAETQARLQTEIASAIRNLQSEVETQTSAETRLSQSIAETSAALIDSRSRESQLRNLQAEVSTVRSRLKLLTDNYEQMIALAGWRNAAAQVIVPAKPVEVPTGPNIPLIVALSFGGSLAAGILVALLLNRRDTGFQSADDASAALDLPCLGMVPKRAKPVSTGIGIFEEAARSIALSLEMPSASGRTKVILVTSSVPGEGKSILAMSLARSVGGLGRRALVIDWAGGRTIAPEQDVRPALENDVGETDHSLFRAHSSEPVVLIRPETGRLSNDVYTDPSFGELLREAREHFDVILIEAPPVLLSSDFMPLASFADCVLHVIGWNRTPRAIVDLAIRRLQGVAATLKGFVLNNVDMTTHRSFRTIDQCSIYDRHREFFSKQANAA